MAETISVKFKLDAAESAASVRQFSSRWTELLRALGNTPTEIRAFYALAKDVTAGKVAVESLDAETRKLIETYQQFRTLASARQQLNLIPQQQIAAEVEKLRGAYDTLRTSGKLTAQELAQAQAQLQARTAELERGTVGWAEALGQAKGELAAAAAAAGGLTLATNAAIDFETALYKVAKTANVTPDQLAALSAQFRELATQVPLSASALAEIAAVGGQLNIAAGDIRQFTELVAKLATAFDIAPTEAAKSVAKLKTVFGLGLTEVERLGDAVNQLGNNTAARENDIVEVLARIGGTAKNFGLAADQAAALAAAFLALGRPPEIAATAINALVTRLQTASVGSEELRTGLARLGISTEQLASNIKANPQQAVLALLRSLQKLDAQARAETLTRLFGMEYQDDVALLVGSLGEYEKALGLVANKERVAGSLQQEFDKRLKTTQAQLDILKNSVNDAAINLGSALLPAVNVVVHALGQGAASIAAFIQQFPALSSAAALLATAATAAKGLELALLAVTAAGARLSTVTAAITALRTEITLATLASNKFSTAFAAVAALEVGWSIGEKLREEYAGVRKFGVALVGGLMEVAEGARYAWELTKAAFTDDTFEAAGERHRQRLSALRDEFTQMFIDAEGGPKKVAAAANQAAAAASRLGTAGKDAAAQLVVGGNAAAEAFKRLPLAVQEAIDKLQIAKRQSEALGPVFAALLNEGLFTGAVADGVQRVADTLDLLRQRSILTNTEIQSGLSATLAGLSGDALLRFQQDAQRAFGGAQGDAERLGQFLSGTLAAALTKLGVDAGSVGAGFSQASADAADAFHAVVNNGTASAEAVRGAFAGALAKVSTVADADTLADLFRQWAQAAGLSGTEIERALQRVRDRVQAIRGAADPVVQAFADLGLQSKASLDQAAERARLAFAQIRDSGTASAGDVQRAFLAYAEAALAAARAAGDGSEQTIRAQLAAEAAARGVADQFDRIAGAAGGAGDAAQRAGQQIEQAGQQGGDTLDRIAAGVDQLAAGVTTTSSAFGEAIASIDALGGAALDLFSSKLTAAGFHNIAGGAAEMSAKIDTASNDTETLRAALEALTQQASALENTQDGDFWLKRWSVAAIETKKEFVAAKLAVAEATQTLESGTVSAQQLARAESVARSEAALLGAEQLSGLRAAIDSARQKIEALRDDLASTLASARSELAQLRGDSVEVERLRYAQQTAELRSKTAEAQASGDRKAIADAAALAQVYEQIHKAKQEQAQRDAQQQQQSQQAAEAQRQQTATATSPTVSSASTGTRGTSVLGVYELKLNAGGQTRTLRTLDNPADVLAQVERDALRSAR